MEINPRNKKGIPDSFLYIDLESVKQGELVKHVISDKKGAPSRAQRLLEQGDILYSCVRPYQHNNYLFTDSQIAVASTGFACLRGAECPEFLYQLLNTDRFTNAVLERCTGTSYPAINSTDLSSIKVMVPSKNEQLTIGTLIGLIGSRITVQNKIIEELLTLKKALYNKVFGTDAFICRDITLNHFMKMPDSVREMHPDRHKLITVRLNEGGVIKNTNVETLKMASTVYYRRSAGQFIYGKQNIFHGAFGIVPGHLDGYASSGDVPALDFKEGVNSSFLMRSMSFSCYSWEKYASGTGSKRIHEKSLLELQVRMPSSGFVERLEKMFAALEQRIERNRRTLNLYLTQKRYLLSQLFI